MFQVDLVLEDGSVKEAAFVAAMAMRQREGSGDSPRADTARPAMSSDAEATSEIAGDGDGEPTQEATDEE